MNQLKLLKQHKIRLNNKRVEESGDYLTPAVSSRPRQF